MFSGLAGRVRHLHPLAGRKLIGTTIKSPFIVGSISRTRYHRRTSSDALFAKHLFGRAYFSSLSHDTAEDQSIKFVLPQRVRRKLVVSSI